MRDLILGLLFTVLFYFSLVLVSLVQLNIQQRNVKACIQKVKSIIPKSTNLQRKLLCLEVLK